MPTRRFRPAAPTGAGPCLDHQRARQRALALLARRDFTRRQLHDRLVDDGASAEVAETVVENLTLDGALDDRRVALTLARRSLVVRRRGRLRALRELTGAGLDAEVARSAIAETLATEDEAALLEGALDRHARGPLTDPRHVRRAFTALLRQGFPANAVRAALARRAKAPLPVDLPDPDA